MGLPGAQSEPGPSLSSEGGMGSLMREFLDVQQLREDRYLRELRGLRESILQTFRPAPVTPSYTRSMRMELSTPAPRRVSTDNAPVQLTDSPPRASTQQSCHLVERRCRCQFYRRGMTSRAIFGDLSDWPGPGDDQERS